MLAHGPGSGFVGAPGRSALPVVAYLRGDRGREKDMEDTDLHQAAIARLEAKREFWGHVRLHRLDAQLVVVSATTKGGEYF
jgi:hypothetical protein